MTSSCKFLDGTEELSPSLERQDYEVPEHRVFFVVNDLGTHQDQLRRAFLQPTPQAFSKALAGGAASSFSSGSARASPCWSSVLAI